MNFHMRSDTGPSESSEPGRDLLTRIIDYAFIIGDQYRFSVAKSARRAILSTRCNPLLIPKDRRRRSDQITLTLNPRVIFRRY